MLICWFVYSFIHSTIYFLQLQLFVHLFFCISSSCCYTGSSGGGGTSSIITHNENNIIVYKEGRKWFISQCTQRILFHGYLVSDIW